MELTPQDNTILIVSWYTCGSNCWTSPILNKDFNWVVAHVGEMTAGELCFTPPKPLISQVLNTVKSANTKKDQYPQVWRKNRQWHQEEVVLHDYCFDWQNCQLMPVYRVNLLILVHTHVQITMSFSETGLWERHYSGTVWSHWRKGEGLLCILRTSCLCSSL